MDKDDAMTAPDCHDVVGAALPPRTEAVSCDTTGPTVVSSESAALVVQVSSPALSSLEIVTAQRVGGELQVPDPVRALTARWAVEFSGMHRIQKIIVESLAPAPTVQQMLLAAASRPPAPRSEYPVPIAQPDRVIRNLAGPPVTLRRFALQQSAPVASQLLQYASGAGRAQRLGSGINLMNASWRPLFATDVLPAGFSRRVADILRHVRDRVAAANADTFERELYAVALQTRQTILSEPDSRPQVAHFTRVWLGVRAATRHVLEAVVEALLEDDWHEIALSDDELRRHLRQRARNHHEVLRPLTDRQLNKQKVVSLSTPTGTADTTYEQVVADPGTVEDEVLLRLGCWNDDRLNRLFGKLDPAGVAITTAYAQNAGTWEQAAVAAGYPPHSGEAVRRRLKNLRNEERRRGGLILPANDGRWTR
ncbi:hypothetical protein [Actinoplanes sp. NPDC051859]|uniref:hypothetical protein n=1 Tax=Actinoplanes sp. NPDC051859 TaxID=3363909 RepID=UPI0037B487C9